MLIVVLLQVRTWRLERRRAQAMTRLAVVEQSYRSEQDRRLQQREFIGMLTHELKTPLSVITVAMGLRDPSDSIRDKANQAIRDIDSVIDKCARSNAIEGDTSIVREEYGLVDSLTRLCEKTGEAHRITIAFEGAPETVRTDAQLLETIVGNLLDNAIKYAAPDSNIGLTCSAACPLGHPGVAIAVSNLPGAAGWPDPQHVFQQYYRSPMARRQTGTGLGLYISGLLARRIGGELHYAPDSEHVRFVLCIPR